jgi:hypothetical protein
MENNPLASYLFPKNRSAHTTATPLKELISLLFPPDALELFAAVFFWLASSPHELTTLFVALSRCGRAA